MEKDSFDKNEFKISRIEETKDYRGQTTIYENNSNLKNILYTYF